jgi:cobalt-zinc-cadmium efflux system protein
VLAEQVPPHLDVGAVTTAILSDPAVSEVHDLHIWAVCPTLVCMTAHLRVGGTTLSEGIDAVARTRRRMEEQFGILHCVFEVEAAPPG